MDSIFSGVDLRLSEAVGLMVREVVAITPADLAGYVINYDENGKPTIRAISPNEFYKAHSDAA